MRLAISTAVIAVALAGSAGEVRSNTVSEPKCLKAEINPVTGHLLCIDPLGAPVEAPPEETMRPCKPEQARGQWTYGSGCTQELDGM